MWERKTGYCENCHHHQPKTNNCIDCYVEKLTRRSHEFMSDGNEVNSREATKLASYLQKLGISLHDKTKKYVAH